MLVLRTTKASISMRNETLQLELEIAILGEVLWSAATRGRFVPSLAIACG